MRLFRPGRQPETEPGEIRAAFGSLAEWEAFAACNPALQSPKRIARIVEHTCERGISSAFLGTVRPEDVILRGANYREDLLACRLNPRQRAVLDLLAEDERAADPHSLRLFAHEAVTPLALALRIGGQHGCRLIIQSDSADAASIPSIAVVSLDAEERAFRVETIARSVVPPVDGGGPAWRLDRQDKLHVLGHSSRAGTCTFLVHRRVRERPERQRLGVLSYDPANGGLLTDWVAGDQLASRHAGSRGWRPDPLDRFTALGDTGAPGRFRLIAQSRSLRDHDRHCTGVLSYRGAGAGLVTEQVLHDVLPPPPFPQRC